MCLLGKIQATVDEMQKTRLADKIVIGCVLDRLYGINGPTNRELAYEIISMQENMLMLTEEFEKGLDILEGLAKHLKILTKKKTVKKCDCKEKDKLWEDLSEKDYKKKAKKDAKWAVRDKIKGIAAELFSFVISEDFKRLDEKMAEKVAVSYQVLKQLDKKSKFYFREELWHKTH